MSIIGRAKVFHKLTKNRIIGKLVKLADHNLVCLLAIKQDDRAKILEIKTEISFTEDFY